MEEMPRVSIIIPVYNGADYLREAIESALSQSYPNCEVIVVNDGSTDNGATEAVARAYGARIRYFQKENGGAASALNFGIRQMTGEFFAWLSHDDLYLPDKIMHQMKEYGRLPKETILYSPYVIWYPELHLSVKTDFSKKATAQQLDTPMYPVFHRMVNGCTVLFHRSHFDRVGFFDESLRTTQDYDFWFRLFQNQHVHCCRNFDVKVRINKSQGSRVIESHAQQEDALWIAMLQKTSRADMCRVSGTERLFYLENEAICGRHGNRAAAEYCARRAQEVLAERQRVLTQESDTAELEPAILAEQVETLLSRIPKKNGLTRLMTKQNLVYFLYEVKCKGLRASIQELKSVYSFRHTI